MHILVIRERYHFMRTKGENVKAGIEPFKSINVGVLNAVLCLRNFTQYINIVPKVGVKIGKI
jgi:hypothetical protein